MAKKRTHFLCASCGSVHAKWFGKCPDCGTWDSLQEYKEQVEDTRAKSPASESSEALPINNIPETDTPRLPTGIAEFDRICGGGVVPGSAILVGGEPGIGKSTLLLQVANSLAAKSPAATTLYCTSEESARQTAMRAARLGAKQSNLLVLAEANLDRIIQQIQKHKPAVAIIDSIQMIYKPELPAAPGSVTQLRECGMDLVYLAKSSNTAIVLVGHVTKEGALAGPKILEHIVDTVVYFEGDRHHAHRVVRCVKNRFGSTHEVGLFEMTGSGLKQVADPGKLFMEEHGPSGPPSGCVITAAMQGSRILLVETQALTASSVIGAAKRKTSGVSPDRVAMIIAVLEKRCDLRLAADDVFVNIAGGVKIVEPAIDLSIALAIASAHLNRPLAAGTLALGELGLGGEIRSVPQIEYRLKEAARLGCSQTIIPKFSGPLPKLGGVALRPVRTVADALKAM